MTERSDPEMPLADPKAMATPGFPVPPASPAATVEPEDNGHTEVQEERPVPLMDPKRVYPEWGPQAEQTVVEILRSHAYVKGRHVAGFETEFADYVGTSQAVAVDSCTDALYLVLRAVLQDRPEHEREVILPTFTFVATAGAVVNAGGRPVFADVDVDTHNIAPASVAALVSERTAAVIPVHLFGLPADLDGVREAIRSFKGNGRPFDPESVFILEDAAQAIHSTVDGRLAGSLANAGTFSFYPSKNLGAAGDGGIVTTDDTELADLVRALRDHGQTRKLYDHARVGTNSRMDEIQAALLRLKLPLIPRWTEGRRAVAARYDAAFQGTSVRPQHVPAGMSSAYHLYTVRLDNRDEVADALRGAGVGCGVYYPQPLHRQTCFAQYEAASCPNAEALSGQVLSLPCFPGLTEAEQARVIDRTLAAAQS